MSGYRFGEPVAGEVEFFGHDVVAGNLSRPAPPLKAVLTGDREMGIAKNRVDVRNRSPADQCQRAPGAVVELKNQPAQNTLENYLRRRRRNVDQRPVDVEEVGP